MAKNAESVPQPHRQQSQGERRPRRRAGDVSSALPDIRGDRKKVARRRGEPSDDPRKPLAGLLPTSRAAGAQRRAIARAIAQTACVSESRARSQTLIRFQLVKIRLTTFLNKNVNFAHASRLHCRFDSHSDSQSFSRPQHGVHLLGPFFIHVRQHMRIRVEGERADRVQREAAHVGGGVSEGGG